MTRRDDTDAGSLTTTCDVPLGCTLEGFTREVRTAEGIGLDDLEALTSLAIRTLNSVYRVIVLEPLGQRILIQGGQYFPEMTEARLTGATLGGSMLKLSWLGCGLRMEVCSAGQRIVTSPVQSIALEGRSTVQGPF